MNYLFSELGDEARELHKGPRRKFGAFHYFRALGTIRDEKRIGRARISSLLGIGEGSVRTLLDGLEEAKLISRNNAGIVLTERGSAALSRFPIRLCRIGRCALFPGLISSAALISGRGHAVSNGIKQRDAAVRNGGTGAITMVVTGGRLSLPPDNKTVDDGSAMNAAFSTLGAADGDAVIVGAAGTGIGSEMAAFYAAATLVRD